MVIFSISRKYAEKLKVEKVLVKNIYPSIIFLNTSIGGLEILISSLGIISNSKISAVLLVRFK
jgi:hypothetical protein